MSDYTAYGYALMYGEMSINPKSSNKNILSIPDTLKLHMMEVFISRLSKSDSWLIIIASPKFGATTSEVFFTL